MRPATLSASSLNVASLCPARWKAEYVDKIPGMSGNAANVGTAFHGGAEKFVKLCYIEKTHKPTEELLIQLYQIAYIETFGNADFTSEEYKDALALIKKWYKRTSFEGVEVLSVEEKDWLHIPIEYRGEKDTIDFTYIIDRLDRIGPGSYRVVDYKTIRVPLQPEDLDTKIQARAYALAVQKKYPDAVRIQVVFDQIRFDPVGLVFTREENIATAHYLMGEAQRLIDMDETEALPALNMECGFCTIKASCELLQKNLAGGGIHSLTTVDEMVELKLKLESQVKAAGYLLGEIEDKLLKEAVDRDALEWATEDGRFQVEITMSRRRNVDASAVAIVIGPEIFSKMGNITMGALDDLLKGTELSPEKKQELQSLIYYKNGDPKAKVKKVTTLV